MKKILFILTISLILFPAFTLAVSLYLEPSSGEYRQGDTFIVAIKINTEDECINTVETSLEYSKDLLEVVDFNRANSVLSIWLDDPSISNEQGQVSFAGGAPGGYCGTLPGDPGEADILGKIIFKVKKVPQMIGQSAAMIEFLNISQVLLNDGFGTPARVKTRGASFTILAEVAETPQNEWEKELSMDRFLPESFEIEIRQDPIIFDGQYFIVFQTQDKQTGIDHYEILETKDKTQENWKKAESPYLLEDQGLQSIIKVKAVDKAGNERITEYIPKEKPFPYWLALLVLMGVGIIIWTISKITRKK